ncbi:MAG: hydratase [Burkholderiaceae bacterium]
MQVTTALADALLGALDAASRLALPTAGDPGFDLDVAYAVADRIRARRIARGEIPRGYKIGFTNRSIWDRYGVHAPIWGPVWDSTLRLLEGDDATVSMAGLVQPRLEPEIVFGFARAPRAGMREAELVDCLEWVAHGVEIVHTHFDDWRFRAPDTVADFALHGRLLVGPRVPVNRFAALGDALAQLRVELLRDGRRVDEGQGHVVLDGPLTALRLWVDAMLAQPQRWPIGPGDVVTTGTLTDAWPLERGQHWETRLSEPRLSGLRLTIVD